MPPVPLIVVALLAAVAAITVNCHGQQKPAPKTPSKYAVKITKAPYLTPGPSGSGDIAGTATGPNVQTLKVVIYAKGGDMWYVQPTSNAAIADIGEGGKWRNSTHGGTLYATLLVKSTYRPRDTMGSMPKVAGNVLATTTASATR